MLNVLSANRKSLSQWSALRIMRVEPSTGYCTRLGWRLIEKTVQRYDIFLTMATPNEGTKNNNPVQFPDS